MVEESSKMKSNKKAKSDGNPKVDTFHNKDGLLLKTYAWTVNDPVGIVVLVHGLKSNLKLEYLKHNIEIREDYKKATLKDADDYYIYKGSWIESLNKNNYSVYGLDLQGHGVSEGWRNLRAHVNKFDDFVYDVIQYLNRIHDLICLSHKKDSDATLHDNITNTKIPPFFLIGISMGGNIVLRILEIIGKSKDSNKKVNIKGCVVLAGMISLENNQKRNSVKYFFMPVGKVLCSLFPTFRLSPAISHEKFTFVNDVYYFDKNYFRKPVTCKFIFECLNAVENLKTDMSYIAEDAHLLFFHSKEDNFCYYEGMVEFTKQLKNKSVEVVTVENMGHALVMEPGNENVLSKILEWMSVIIKQKPGEEKKNVDVNVNGDVNVNVNEKPNDIVNEKTH